MKELLLVPWLSDERRDGAPLARMALDLSVGVAGHQDARGVGPAILDGREEENAVLAAHVEIREHEVKVILLENVEGRLRALRRLDVDGRRLGQTLQDALEQLADALFIIDDEDLVGCFNGLREGYGGPLLG